MHTLADKLALLAHLMTFNTDHPHAEAFNDTVAHFLQEAESCMALVHGHKEVAHSKIVMALLVFVCGLGFAVLLGWFRVGEGVWDEVGARNMEKAARKFE
ncbi:uncharacterized protein QC763_0081650 [Podospora pseudopauciseta]|uniref:Uncharacterized protein n=1 Tax=Podospora pseudopauciseta TaxID=2093780 RepID=A0ABR0H835_9PEZI|nr:hypothetical protein QC763_0081650 [Podospora pseudopauciseta]